MRATNDDAALEIWALKPLSPAGGDLIFRAGKSAAGSTIEFPGGKIRFQTPESVDVFVIEPDGAVRVRGELVAADKDLYEAMKAWFTNARHERE